MSAPLAGTRHALREYDLARDAFGATRNRALATITKTMAEAEALAAEWHAAESRLSAAKAVAEAACQTEAQRNAHAASKRWMHRANLIAAGQPA